MSKIIDGHIHVTEELLPVLRNSGVRCIANADCPAEYALLQTAAVPGLVISGGIHPWKADVTPWAEMEPVLQAVPVIGEIGLDSEWCEVDMDIQRTLFRRQLKLAAALRKPVILHTKGMEREILDTIRQYPNHYLVHWYACPDHLQAYIDLGCWFTVGPELQDQTVRAVAEHVPADRLLIESDGVEGVAWGQGRALTAADYPAAMAEHLAAVAAIRAVTPGALLAQMERNFRAFLHD